MKQYTAAELDEKFVLNNPVVKDLCFVNSRTSPFVTHGLLYDENISQYLRIHQFEFFVEAFCKRSFQHGLIIRVVFHKIFPHLISISVPLDGNLPMINSNSFLNGGHSLGIVAWIPRYGVTVSGADGAFAVKMKPVFVNFARLLVSLLDNLFSFLSSLFFVLFSKEISLMPEHFDILAGIDIGGTKCAVSFAEYRAEQSDDIQILDRVAFPPPDSDPNSILNHFATLIKEKLIQHENWNFSAVGVACGGPLDSARGIIISPSNLPKWRNVEYVRILRDLLNVPTLKSNFSRRMINFILPFSPFFVLCSLYKEYS